MSDDLEKRFDRQTPAVVTDMVVKLLDSAQAHRPAELRLANQQALSTAGLYSWWVDAAGARDLSAGLGTTVEPGLVYVGQAGATRWPSGRRSGNTLWKRLVAIHLDGRAEFSTFRLTLGSVLQDPLGLEHVDDPALTRWMENHLRVVAVAFADADSLIAVAHQVIDEVDPPLNLSGRPSTPTRLRLSELRRVARKHPDQPTEG